MQYFAKSLILGNFKYYFHTNKIYEDKIWINYQFSLFKHILPFINYFKQLGQFSVLTLLIKLLDSEISLIKVNHFYYHQLIIKLNLGEILGYYRLNGF